MYAYVKQSRPTFIVLCPILNRTLISTNAQNQNDRRKEEGKKSEK